MFRAPLALALVAVAMLVAVRPVTAQDTFHVEARVLCRVEVRVPFAPGPQPPLLVVLHGRGGTVEGMRPIWDAFTEPKPVLAVLQAPYSMVVSDGTRVSLGETWASPEEARAVWERADGLVVSYILDTIRTLRQKYKTGRTYLLGHSQGEAFAFLTAVQAPDVVDGVIGIAGRLPEDQITDAQFTAAAPSLRVFVVHGRQDTVVDPARSREAVRALERRGFKVVLGEYDGGHQLTGETLRKVQEWISTQEAAGRPPR